MPNSEDHWAGDRSGTHAKPAPRERHVWWGVEAQSASLANRWIERPASANQQLTSSFGLFAPSTLSRCLGENLGTLSRDGMTTVDGIPAVVVRQAGNLPGSNPGTLAEAKNGPAYPLRVASTGPTRPAGKGRCLQQRQAGRHRWKLDAERFRPRAPDYSAQASGEARPDFEPIDLSAGRPSTRSKPTRCGRPPDKAGVLPLCRRQYRSQRETRSLRTSPSRIAWKATGVPRGALVSRRGGPDRTDYGDQRGVGPWRCQTTPSSARPGVARRRAYPTRSHADPADRRPRLTIACRQFVSPPACNVYCT